MSTFIGVAQAQDPSDPMASRYGNTVIITDSKGQQMKAFFDPDKTVTAIMPDGKTVKGTWELKGNELCSVQTDPVPAPEDPASICHPFEPHAVGDTWTVGEGENLRTATIVQGR